MTTTKKDIVKQIAKRLDLPQVDVKKVVQDMLDQIVDILVAEGRLELRDFGVFQVRDRAARRARNPKTGERVRVPPRRVVTFKPGKLLQDRIRSQSPGSAEGETEPTGGAAPAAPASPAGSEGAGGPEV
jgi:nucleoid DNA-binding protein